MKHSDSFVVTIDKEDQHHIVDTLELSKYALKANVDPDSGSKYTPTEEQLKGYNILNPKYNPYYLVQLLDLYTYHASCVEAVAVDSTGISYSLKPVENVEPVEAEKARLEEVLENSTPSINTQLQRMVYDRRSIGYGAIEIIRDTTSKSDIKRLKHIPAHTLRRHTDQKRVVHINSMGKKVWFVIYGKNYNDDGELCDIDADTGEFKPYNSLPPHQRANELLWSMEYAPGTDYYGRPPIISCLGSIKGDISAVRYNYSFFENYGMPKFAITVTGDFADYDVEPDDPDYDYTKTLKYRISEQIREVIKNPHSAICITIPSEGEEGNVDLKITPLSVQTEEGHFRMYRKDTRDEVIHSHHVDPSRLGIYDAGNLNGTNSDNTMASYKYGTIAPIKAECEALINLIAKELEVTTWKFSIEDVAPIDYAKDLVLAEFLFARGAMTIKDLIDNFGSKFGLDIEGEEEDYYLNARYLNGVPLEQVWNQTEDNPYLEVDSILASLEGNLNEALKAKKQILRTQISNARSRNNERQLERALQRYFKSLEKQVQRNLKFYWQDNLVMGQVDLITEPIMNSHDEYYEILAKFVSREYQLGTQEAERLIHQLNRNRVANKSTKPKARAFLKRTFELFGIHATAEEDLLTRVFIASERTLARVDRSIMDIITLGYKSGNGINAVANELTRRFDQLTTWESKRIARTEIHNAHNRGTMDKYQEFGVEYTMWVAADDERTRESHLEINGEIIRLGDTYSNGLKYPGDTDGPIEEWINCRCSNAPYVIPYGYAAPPMEQFTENDLIKTR